MNDKIASKANNSVELKIDALAWCNMSILRKRVKMNVKNKQQQQQQTLFTSKNFFSLLKTKFNNKVNIPSDKPKTKQK